MNTPGTYEICSGLLCQKPSIFLRFLSEAFQQGEAQQEESRRGSNSGIPSFAVLRQIRFALHLCYASPYFKRGRNFLHGLEYAEAQPGHLKACCWIGVLDHEAPLERTLFGYIPLSGCTLIRSSGTVVNGSDSDKLVIKS